MPRILDFAMRSGAAALLALLLALAGCGPGTGGTGTGPIGITFSGSGGAFTAPPLPGTACDAAPCDRVDLRLEEARVDLIAGCSRFTHAGAWQADVNGLVVFEGAFETTTGSGTASLPATLRLQFSDPDPARAAKVSVLVQGAGGNALLGPLDLQLQGAAPPAVAACTPRSGGS